MGDAAPLREDKLAALAHNAGFSGEALVTVVAIALAESGGDPDAIGDTHLVNATWGPSVGVTQIRSLHRDRGTGRTRDQLANLNPAINFEHAFEISGGGKSFDPWSTYTGGQYQQYLGRAAQASSIDEWGAGDLAGIPGAAAGAVGDAAGDLATGVVKRLVEALRPLVIWVTVLGGGAALVVLGARAAAGGRDSSRERRDDFAVRGLG